MGSGAEQRRPLPRRRGRGALVIAIGSGAHMSGLIRGWGRAPLREPLGAQGADRGFVPHESVTNLSSWGLKPRLKQRIKIADKPATA
jgi:hypothetical protein